MKKILNEKFISIIISLFMFIAMANYMNFNIGTFLGLAIFFMIYVIVEKYFFKNFKKDLAILAFILTICYTLGNLCVQYIDLINADIFSKVLSFSFLLNFIGMFFIIELIISIVINKLVKINLFSTDNFNSKKLFICSFIFIMLCWGVYFLASYPGFIAPDSIYQIRMVRKLDALVDYHPVFHTMFIKVFYNLGSIFFKSENARVAVSVIAQMIVMAAIYSYTITFFNRHKIKKNVLVILTLCFALLPVFAFYSIIIWKDVLFGGFFLLFTLCVYNMVEKKNIELIDAIKFIITSLLIIFFRNNALYMYILIIPFFLFFFRKNILKIGLCFAIVLTSFFIIKYPIFDRLGIEKSKSWEYLGIPIQQVGRIVYKESDNFDKMTVKRIEKFMAIEDLKDSYNPRISDDIKFNPKLNHEYFEKHINEFITLWKDLVIMHPDIAVETYFVSTVGFWSPDFGNNRIEIGITKNDIDLHTNPLLPKGVVKFINSLDNIEIPIIGLQWNIGLIIWIVVISAFLCIKRGKADLLLCFLPALGMWGTLMVASPVNGMLRYIFFLYTTLPFYLLVSYMKKAK